MAPHPVSLAVQPLETNAHYKLQPKQTLRASNALLRKIQSDAAAPKAAASKSNLLEDADNGDVEDEVPLWLVLTTKKHISDKKRLKPGKIVLPHPLYDSEDANLRICLITADPQRKYKDLIEQPGFPLSLGKRIRVVGLEKIKARYSKSFEARRQLLGEYDIFLADDRVITYLPQLLGKTFYKGGSKRPIPVSLQGKRQGNDEQGNKRRKLCEGGSRVQRTEIRPQDVAAELQRALTCTLVHLAPSTTTAVKVGKASLSAEQVRANVDAVVTGMVDKYVPQKWRNLKSVHIKGPNTIALPIWLAEELWEDEQDVLEEAPPAPEPRKKRKRLGQVDEIEVPGPDGTLRIVRRPGTEAKTETETAAEDKASKPAKKAKRLSTKAEA